MATAVISSGIGRLHLANAVDALVRNGCSVDFIGGWAPKNVDSFLVMLASMCTGRDLRAGLRKRIIGIDGCQEYSCAAAEFFCQIIMRIGRLLYADQRRFAVWGWKLFGWQSKWYLKTQTRILHVRSGAGQGGAIARARRLGMKVVVDHSIAHPAFMDRQLRSECERNGVKFEFGCDSPFWQLVLKDCWEADIVQVNSFFVRDTFLEQGFPAEKIRVIYLGEREDFFGLRSVSFTPNLRKAERVRLLFTGGFGFRKGAEYILSALKTLKERGVNYEMDVVGEYSGARSIISRFAKDLDIVFAEGDYQGPVPNHRITFHGPKPQDELKHFLANGDIYVFPSLAEGCAQSGMEAMAAGMCVIGTHECGFPITDGENGCIVPSKDANAIADKIEWLSKNSKEIDRMGENAARLIRENYTWKRYAENVSAMYTELLER